MPSIHEDIAAFADGRKTLAAFKATPEDKAVVDELLRRGTLLYSSVDGLNHYRLPKKGMIVRQCWPEEDFVGVVLRHASWIGIVTVVGETTRQVQSHWCHWEVVAEDAAQLAIKLLKRLDG